jgi:hypothetical protein
MVDWFRMETAGCYDHGDEPSGFINSGETISFSRRTIQHVVHY